MTTQLVTVPNLGDDFSLDTTASKINVKIDGVTLKKAANGTIAVDASELATGPSADTGNLLEAGTDQKLFLDAEKVQDAIGQAIANGVGIEYDDAMDALKVAMGNMQVAGTDSVELVLDLTTDPDQPGLSANVKLNATITNNLLKLTAGEGLGVDPDDVIAVIKGDIAPALSVDLTDPAAPALKLSVHGEETTQDLEQVTDAFGANTIGYVVKQ